jgi:glycosyltransferase involved in cell wall biosynthesis
MRLRELVAGTRWAPSATSALTRPLVSVVLALEESADSVRTARSVLRQDLAELELIVVDDGSPDAAAAAREALAADPRVHWLHHPRRLGLAAAGVFEAYRRARGEWLAFVFEGVDYRPTALRELYAGALARRCAFVHGRVTRLAQPGREHAPGPAPTPRDGNQSLLRSHNFIAPESALVHRDVFETIGMFDPHVGMARLFAWDLFRRAGDRFALVALDVDVGVRLREGPGQALEPAPDHAAAAGAEWMALPRNAELHPSRVEDYDVHATREAERRGRSPVLIVYTVHDMSTTLYFDWIPEPHARHVRMLHAPSRRPEPGAMAGAAAVVFVRALFEMQPWIELARRLRVPHYYFLDDNLMILADDPRFQARYGAYADDAVRDVLRSFSGVLLSTHALLSYFRERGLHERLHHYPLIARPPRDFEQPAARPARAPLRIGYFGGGHRNEPFLRDVLPAIVELSRRAGVSLVVAGMARENVSLPEGLDATFLPFEESYDVALWRLAQAGIDVLVHPNNEELDNRFRSLTVLVNAMRFGAAPVLSASPPYDVLGDGDTALLCGNGGRPWLEALELLASDPDLRRRVAEGAARHCREHLNADTNRRVLDTILAAPQAREPGRGPVSSGPEFPLGSG